MPERLRPGGPAPGSTVPTPDGDAVLGVSPDDPQELARSCDQEALTSLLLAGPDHEVCAAYGARGEEQVDGRTVTGATRSTSVLDERGRVETAVYDVQARGHVAELRRTLGLA